MKSAKDVLVPFLGVLCMLLLPALSGCGSTPNASTNGTAADQQGPGFTFD